MHLRGEKFRMQPLVLFELFPPWWPWLRAYVFRKGALYLDSAGGGTGVGFHRPPVCNPLKLSASQRGVCPGLLPGKIILCHKAKKAV